MEKETNLKAEKLKKILQEIISEETKNLSEKRFTDTEMIRKIRKIIEGALL
ncbi:MAG: hypothetical protein KKH92_00305 [Firmicutes bacterium]|nr:hypothetical protein [Bacillota bacterium]